MIVVGRCIDIAENPQTFVIEQNYDGSIIKFRDCDEAAEYIKLHKTNDSELWGIMDADAFEPVGGEFEKPPLGAKPGWIVAMERISCLSDAIARYVKKTKEYGRIRMWAKEILAQCDVVEEGLEAEKEYFERRDK